MAPTYQIPKNPSSQLKTVLHYLDCVEVFDLAEIEKLFADDLVQSTAPHNLDVPKRSKQEDLAFLRGLSEQLEGKSFETTIYDIVESPGKVWVHLELHLEFPGEKEIDIECIYQFTLVAHSNSHKIKAIVDFVDSDVFLGMSG